MIVALSSVGYIVVGLVVTAVVRWHDLIEFSERPGGTESRVLVGLCALVWPIPVAFGLGAGLLWALGWIVGKAGPTKGEAR